jgi:tetratricopeptide (TPR) repeat protein
MSQNPDSIAWNAESIAQGINTILVPLSRYQGMTVFPQLQAYCHSRSWSPVYIDEVSAIFVRRTAATEAVIQRLAVDCGKASIPSVAESTRIFHRSNAELFNARANAGGVLYSLGRYPEALDSLNEAERIFQRNASVHLFRALVLQELRYASEAESEFMASLELEPSDEAWFDLGLFYMTRRRYEDAARVFGQGAASSSRPHEMWMLLGQAQLQLHQPQDAIVSLEKAEQTSPFQPDDAFGAPFYSVIATGRAKAYYQLGDVAQAVTFQEDAVRLAPNDSKLWSGLADLYDAQGRPTKAAEARNHAAPR